MNRSFTSFLLSLILLFSLVGSSHGGSNNCRPAWKCQPTPSPTSTIAPTPKPTLNPTPNPTYSVGITPNDPIYPQQDALRQTHTNSAWEVTTGSTIIIATIDLGADLDHPELVGKLVQGRDVINGDNDPQENALGHGTATMGIVAASTNNNFAISTYCWDCKGMPIKAYQDNGSTTWSALETGVRWAADHGAKIISMSWCCGYTTGLQDAIKYAYSKNIILIGAGGSQWVTWPEVIGTVGVNKDGTNAEGREGDIGVPYCNWTLAMGTGYYEFCAASSTAPALAGIVGLGLSHCPNALPAQITQKLKDTGDTIPNSTTKLVNAGAFIDALC